MDHLPYPANPVLPPLSVPYLCRDVESYDGQGLRDFPLRAGWVTSSINDIDSGRVQSWLYFGLLTEMFGETLKKNDFIDTTSDGRQYVVTRNLPNLLRDCCQENSRMYVRMASLGFRDTSQKGFLRGRPRIRLNERLAGALVLAAQLSDLHDTGDNTACVVALSVKVLVWSISNALKTYLPSYEKLYPTRHSRLLGLRMLESGKCPYWTEIYLREYSVAMVYYLASVASIDGANHEGCSANECIAHNIDEQHYTTKHVKDDCPCEMTLPEIVGKVTSIIENDGVPLIRLKEEPSGDLSLDVVQASYGTHYTAISHVWSGGLGNTVSNSLPQCQLKSIRRGLKHARNRAHSDSGLYPWNNDILKNLWYRKRPTEEVFWMDTLCIPVGLGKTLRRKAIARMNFTFAGADNVLVIDPALQSLLEDDLSKLQLRLHIACSPWMSRCWTFQEACLARAWHVYLRNSLYTPAIDYRKEINLLFRIHTKKTLWTDESELECEAISFYRRMWPLADQELNYKPPIFVEAEGSDVYVLKRIWNELNERSTTRSGDCLIILAVLLDLNAGEIMSLQVEEQMRAIFRTQTTLPLSLLFEPQMGPVSENAKCRWIPRYLRGEMSTRYGCMMRKRAEGLYQFKLCDIKARGFLLNATDSHHGNFFVDQTSPSSFRACVDIIQQDEAVAESANKVTCILLSQLKKRTSDPRAPFVGARFFVEDISTEGETLTLTYDGPLAYHLVKEYLSLQPSQGCPKLATSAISEATTLLLDCDFPTWYEPRISRAESLGVRQRTGIQSPPYVALLFCLIGAIWLFGFGIGIALIAHAMLTWGLTEDQLDILGYSLIILLGVIIIRAAIFLLLEAQFLFRIAGERQYYRWACTFSGVNPSKFTAVDGFKHLSCQYRPWWLAVLLILVAITLIVTGLRFHLMLWAVASGAALLIETVMRITLEVLWLRTPLGTIGKRVRLRWLPWLSIPVRAYSGNLQERFPRK